MVKALFPDRKMDFHVSRRRKKIMNLDQFSVIFMYQIGQGLLIKIMNPLILFGRIKRR